MTTIEHPFEAQSGLDFHIPDDVLLSVRACDLGVRLEDVGIDFYQKKLDRELLNSGITRLKPKFFLGDEWFCPEASASIAVPFWLAHPRVKKLEKSLIGRVEGSSAKEFMMLLRHEMGHCLDHAYRLSRRSDWKEVFGDPKVTYNPDSYKWHPNSKDFVVHLPEGYSQAHPEEDFAETFAVWLDPSSQWRRRYKTWPVALKKLYFVERLIKEIGQHKPMSLSYKTISNISRSKKTLKSLYSLRSKLH